MQIKIISSSIYVITCGLIFSSCEKLLEVPPPINSITTEEIFATNKQAEWTVSAMYSKMINGTTYTGEGVADLALLSFSAGLSTIQGGLSADELTATSDRVQTDRFSQYNQLTAKNSVRTIQIWNTAFRTVYDANAIIDGIAQSTSPDLTDSVRKQLTGEALAIRAFSYFYLLNFFGDLPFPLNSDTKNSVGLSRTPIAKIYDQIKNDLVRARGLLASDYTVSKNERVRVNKWFAEALLARIYLFSGNYQEAINSATAVINHTSLFSLEQDPALSFLPNSSEAIFQLLPGITNSVFKNGTAEGYMFNRTYNFEGNLIHQYALSDGLLAAFEMNDKRKAAWTLASGSIFIPAKYTNSTRKEYYTVMRLAELYLIRAEATVLLTPGAKNNAIDDLNILRRRAGLNDLDYQLSATQVVDAVAQERKVEFFAEWGHRWLDLKRTGKARTVLSAISYKQPWLGDYQLLYPIPETEIAVNAQLVQNPQYEF